MAFKVLADTFSVTRGANDFVQVKTLKSPHHPDEVWAAFAMSGDPKVCRAFFESAIAALEDVYFEESESDAYERFENALREINADYKDLKEKKGTVGIKSVSAVIGIFSQEQLHLTQASEAEAYLIRNNQLSLITDGLSGRSEDLFVNIASGQLQLEDKVIFSTSRLLRLMARSQLLELCKDGVAESADALREAVMGDPELSVAVACTHLKPGKHSAFQAESEESPYFGLIKRGWAEAMSWLEEKWGDRKPINKKVILASLTGMVALLALSITVVGSQNRKNELREEYRQRITTLNEDITAASTKGYADDKETANAILDKAEEEAKAILASEFFREEILGLMEKIQSTRDSVNNILRPELNEPYADLAAKTPDANALGLTFMEGGLFAYGASRLQEMALDQVAEAKAIGLNERIVKGKAMEDQRVIAFLAESGKILEYEAGEFRMATNGDEAWQKATDIATYGRNLYLLNPEDNQIYKYSRQRSGYAGATKYNVDADLTKAKALAIDGNVYVLKEGGEIIKLLKGEQQPFDIEAMAADLSDASALFTSLDLAHLYVLDAVNKRVVVIEKDTPTGGRYKNQISFESLPEVKSIHVSKGENELYLLTAQAIYRVDI